MKFRLGKIMIVMIQVVSGKKNAIFVFFITEKVPKT